MDDYGEHGNGDEKSEEEMEEEQVRLQMSEGMLEEDTGPTSGTLISIFNYFCTQISSAYYFTEHSANRQKW